MTDPVDEYSGIATADPSSAAKPVDEYAGLASDNRSSETEKVSAFGKGANVGLSDMIALPFDAARGLVNLPNRITNAITPDDFQKVPDIVGGNTKEMFRSGLAETGMGFENISDLPQDQRPFAVGGEVIAQSIPFAAAPLAAANAGARLPANTLVGRWVNKVIDWAAASPGAFIAGEASMAASSAAAGGTAEAFVPGQAGPRAAAEIAGGFLNPSRYVIGGGKMAVDGVKKAVQSLSPSGRETRAAKILAEIMEETGEDPAVLAKLLRESGIPGTELTAAQKTASPGLMALEAHLSKESARFGGDAAKMADESLDTMKNMIIALRGTGDPAAFAEAAKIKQTYFRALINGRVQAAQNAAIDAASKISKDSPGARATLSRQAGDAVESALADARKVEGELWGQVPTDISANVSGVLKRYDEIRGRLLPEEKLPEIVEGFIARMREGGGASTTGEILKFRSRALALAREAAGRGERGDASIYGQLAEAALDDMDAVFKGVDSGVLRTFGITQEAYADARAFSRELHDTFTRTFAGNATAKSASGADRIPPEITMRRALGSGKEGGDLRLLELENATKFMTSRGLGGPEAVANVGIMLDAQERVVRLAAAEAVDPNTGLVNPGRLSKFIRDNDALLTRLNVKSDLENAVKGETDRRALEALYKGADRAIERRAAFAKVTGRESPSDVVRAAVAGANPSSDLRALAKLAKTGGSDAVEGLGAAVWDNAIRRATSETGELSLPRLRSALFDPVKPGSPSVAEIMQREGVFQADDITRAGKLFEESAKITKAVEDGGQALEALEQSPSALFDVLLRIRGAQAGTALAGGVGGAGTSLIAAQQGSKYFRRVFEKLPSGRINDVLIQAAKDPAFMAMLLKKAKTQQEGMKMAMQIHAYMFRVGLIEATAEEDE
jgi:hypothetical protein